MPYRKPEVEILGEAIAIVASAFSIKAWSSPDGFPILIGIHSVPAYDLDD